MEDKMATEVGSEASEAILSFFNHFIILKSFAEKQFYTADNIGKFQNINQNKHFNLKMFELF